MFKQSLVQILAHFRHCVEYLICLLGLVFHFIRLRLHLEVASTFLKLLVSDESLLSLIRLIFHLRVNWRLLTSTHNRVDKFLAKSLICLRIRLKAEVVVDPMRYFLKVVRHVHRVATLEQRFRL